MIYGILPVGGKGTRLSLPFPKELLPQKGFDHYNPVINHIVQKMLEAGADVIYFVHGNDYKQGIVDFYPDSKYSRFVHLIQRTPGFATVLRDFYETGVKLTAEDKILFGMPDTIFEGNPFIEMIKSPGIVCGLFSTDPYTKVDRLHKDNEQLFQVKSAKNDYNQNWFWGVLKFDGIDLNRIIADKVIDLTMEVGLIISGYPKTYVHCESYLDLGTWTNYNRYLALYGGDGD